MDNNKIVILFPKPQDIYFNRFKDQTDFVKIIIDGIQPLKLLKTGNNDLYVLIRDYNIKAPNWEYWNLDNLNLIEQKLKINFNKNELEIIIAVHWGGMENSSALRDQIEPITNRGFTLKNGKFYLTFYSDNNDEIASKSDNEIYSFIILRLEKLTFEYHKRQIINRWLPLAIDIQGLSEVQNDIVKSKKYFEEIKKETEYLNSLSSFPKEEDFPRWEEIKEKLQNGYKDFNPIELVNEITNKSFSNFDKKYYTDPNFLPHWLQEVVNIIDKKIKESSEPIEENEADKS